MDRTPAKRQERRDRSQGWRRPARCTLLVVAAAVGLITTPGIATASSLPASHMTRAAKPATCAGARAVSRTVGWTVPEAKYSGGSSTFDQKYNVSDAWASCAYGSDETATYVVFGFFRLSKSLSPLAIEQRFEELAVANKPAAANYTIVPYTGLGVLGLYEQDTEAGHTLFAAMIGIQGKRVATAAVLQALSKSRLSALTKLATANFF
jgi:hypothetical protein